MQFKVSKNIVRNPMNSDINLTNIGVGTYLGEVDELDDLKVLLPIDSAISLPLRCLMR